MSSSFKSSNTFGSVDSKNDVITYNVNSFLYHGSTVDVKDPRILRGKFAKDFGPGFYVTLIKIQA